jgi:hypothetical protein
MAEGTIVCIALINYVNLLILLGGLIYDIIIKWKFKQISRARLGFLPSFSLFFATHSEE